MGNLELEQTQKSRRKPIFQDTQYRKKSLSPRPLSQRFDTVKHKNRKTKDCSNDKIDTFRKQTKQNNFDKSQVKRQDRGRIANFNEFMHEVKKQLQNHSVHQEQFEENQKSTSSKNELVLKLKLENEKMELQKYKRLVEKELSKNHSIESVRLEGRGEKRLIIQYQPDRKVENHKIIKERIQHEKKKYQIGFQKAQQQYKKLSENLKILQQLFKNCQFEEEEQQSSNNLSSSNERSPLGNRSNEIDNIPSQRANKIANMIEGLDKLCTGLNPIEEEIRSALQICNFDSVSSSSQNI